MKAKVVTADTLCRVRSCNGWLSADKPVGIRIVLEVDFDGLLEKDLDALGRISLGKLRQIELRV